MIGSKQRPQGTYDSDLLLMAEYATGAADTTHYGLDGDGGDAIVLDVGEGLFRGMAIIDISAIVTGGDEIYEFSVQGGNNADFDDETALLGTLKVGGEANIDGESADSTAGRYKLLFDNEKNGTFYPFIRLQIERTEATANVTSIAYVVPLQ